MLRPSKEKGKIRFLDNRIEMCDRSEGRRNDYSAIDKREDSSEVEERDCEATKIIDFSTIDKRRENFSANRVDRQKKQFQKQRNTRSKGKKRERLENIELNGELNPEWRLLHYQRSFVRSAFRILLWILFSIIAESEQRVSNTNTRFKEVRGDKEVLTIRFNR